MVHVDARRPGVLVPQEYAGEPHLRLNLSYRFQIPDLEVTESGVEATLSFRGQHFHCKLPWSAVFGITSQLTGDGQVWPEDLPSEVEGNLEDGEEQTPAPDRPAAAAGRAAVTMPDPAQTPQRGLRLADGARRERLVRPERRQRAPLVAVAAEAEPESEDGAGPDPAALERAEPAQPGQGPAGDAAQGVEAPAQPADGSAEAPAQPAPGRGHLRLVR